jgi:PKD repeat protein
MMKLAHFASVVLAVALVASGISRRAEAETVVEVCSRYLKLATSVSANPTDGSVWAAGYGGVRHLASDCTLLFSGGNIPISVSVNPSDGSCWVADDGTGEVYHFASDGSPLWSSENSEHPSANAVSVNSTDGSCWVGGTAAIMHYASDGTRLLRVEGFNLPASVSVNPTDGSCWVADTYHNQIVHLANDGTELWRSPGLPTFAVPACVSVNPTDGTCWVADGLTVVHLGPDGRELWRSDTYPTFFAPTSVSVNPRDGSCWVADQSNHQVVHLAHNGAELWRGGGFNDPYGVCVNPTDGSCWVADTANNRVVHLGIVTPVVPTADFGASPLAGRLPLQVTFSDRSTGYPSAWSWDFGDGGTSTLQNPSHIYQLPGTYTVTLTVSNDIGSDAKTQSGYILVSGFSDVLWGHWAFSEVYACVDAGIVAGYPDGTYLPSNPVTRDQMAVYISRALAGGDGNVPEFSGTPTFPDVPEGFWALDYVEYAVDQNVVTGYDDGNYHPEYEVTRDQMAVYVARALVAPSGEAGLADYTPSDPRDFPDVPSGFWAYRHVEYCVEQGVVNGYEDGKYHPEIVVTRDQMAVYIARAFGLMP